MPILYVIHYKRQKGRTESPTAATLTAILQLSNTAGHEHEQSFSEMEAWQYLHELLELLKCVTIKCVKCVTGTLCRFTIVHVYHFAD